MESKSSAHQALLNCLSGQPIDGKFLVSPNLIKKISSEIQELENTNKKMADELIKYRNTRSRFGSFDL